MGTGGAVDGRSPAPFVLVDLAARIHRLADEWGDRVRPGSSEVEPGGKILESTTARPHPGRDGFPGTAGSARFVTMKDICWFVYLCLGRPCSRFFPRLAMMLQRPGAWLARRLARGERSRLTRRMRIAALDERQIPDIIDQYLGFAVGRALSDLQLDQLVQRLPAENLELVGREHLDAARSQGRGVILASGHFFASRLAKRVLKQRGVPIVSVRHPAPPDPGMGRSGRRWLQDRYMRFLHTVIGDEIVSTAPDCAMQIMRRLRSGEIVNLHIDAPFATQSMRAPFLGQDQTFSDNLARLIRLTDAALVPFWFSGDHRGLKIEFEPALEQTHAPEQFMPELLERLERRVLDQPADYELWIML